MAADPNAQDRNLPASQQKLDKARKEGRVARSRDLGHFVAMAVGGTALVAFAPLLVGWMQALLASGLQVDRAAMLAPAAMGERLAGLTLKLLAVVLPIGALMVVAALAGGVASGGWTWTLKPVMPDFGKLNPLTGLPGLLSKDKLVDALKGSFLALVLGAIGAFYLASHVDAFTGVLGMAPPAALAHVGRTIVAGLLPVLGALFVFALIDVPMKRRQHAQQLKMSHQEVKQETRENEGNVEIKAKVRARMREMTKRRMLAAVPKADLVVMNPTHYAVALKYDEAKMGAPRVVAKGADLLALRIRDAARGAQVPVLQAPVLARALYAHAELDREIPAQLFAAVAQVLAYVYQLRMAMKGKAPMPAALPAIDVPDELDPYNEPGHLERLATAEADDAAAGGEA